MGRLYILTSTPRLKVKYVYFSKDLGVLFFLYRVV